MTTVISAEGLGKKYLIRHKSRAQYSTLRDVLAARAKQLGRGIFRPFSGGANKGAAETREEFWALRDVSFEIRDGERVGIIGRNGAGKSTLLKILSRITEPSAGRVTITGRVASLLEVGTGFHPELSGRENVFLNGAILGMSKAEIKRKFDEIVAFAEVEKFLDTPVKRYSSGMYVRLAFAVAAHLEPEILVVDEVLAVGDMAFQRKCLGKMEGAAAEGRTVIFVSHNMGAITQLCSKAILLKGGKVAFIGAPGDIVKAYLRSDSNAEVVLDARAMVGTLTDTITFHELRINGQAGNDIQVHPSSEIVLTATGIAKKSIPAFRTTFSVSTEGVRLLTLHDEPNPALLPPGDFEALVRIPAFTLRPGEYLVSIGGYRDGASDWLFGRDVVRFTVIEEWSENYEFANFGIINLPFSGARKLITKDSAHD